MKKLREHRGKQVFFTGATGGLGEVSVKALAERGWTVYAAGTNNIKLDALAKIQNVIPVFCDLSDLESIRQAHGLVSSYTDRLDAIVNFAGITAFHSMIEGDSLETAKKMVEINLMGTVRVNYVFFDMVEKGRGRIINCSSQAGWMKAQPFAAAYFMSKHGLEAYNDSLRRELMYLNIPVVKIQPGSFQTKITQNVYDGYDKTLAQTKRYRQVLIRMKPLMVQELRRSGKPEALVKVLIKSMESRNPRIKYRIGTGKLLLLLECLPDCWMDCIYKLLFRIRQASDHSS